MTESPVLHPAGPQRRTLLLLLALFGLPLAVSFFLYYATGWRPQGTSNNGQLFTPVIVLDDAQTAAVAEPLKGKWSLLVVGGGSCDEDCRRSLVFARQTRLSLAKEMERVNRVFLATGDCCDRAYFDAEHPGLKVVDAAQGHEALLARIPAQDREHSVFVVDPLGNLVLRYDSREDPKGLLADMKKLLKLSHIG
jgi:cytochrome oxidase Cu insertion factor (SCO1/SenC/PrrC family)